MNLLIITLFSALWPAVVHGKSICKKIKEYDPKKADYACTDKGTFRIKQCITRNNEKSCRCVYPKTGEIIGIYTATIPKEMAQMNCECALRWITNDKQRYSVRCLPNGNFVPRCVPNTAKGSLQCTGDGHFMKKQTDAKFAYCVDKYTGQRIERYRVDLFKAKNMNCECAQDEVDSRRWSRSQCLQNGNYDDRSISCREKKNFIKAKYGRDGITPHCTRKGKFAAIKCLKTWCFCINTKDGTIIPGYGAHKREKLLMNRCKCARRYGHEGLRKRKCMPNGDYITPCVRKLMKDFTERKHALVRCGKDGYSDPVQCTGYICRCMVPGNPRKYLKNYRGYASSGMNCLCAQKEYLERKDLNCIENGNFPEDNSITTPKCPSTSSAKAVVDPGVGTSGSPGIVTPTTFPCDDTTPPPSVPYKPLCWALAAKYAGDPNQTVSCRADGTFEPLQCILGWCYCAHPLSGRKITPYVFPEKSPLRKNANCKCAVDEQMYGLSSEGLNALCLKNGNYRSCSDEFWRDTFSWITGKRRAKCDCKGKYAKIQCDADVCYCTNPVGQRIGHYRIPLQLAGNKTCECALEEDRLRAAGTIGWKRYACNFYGDYLEDATELRANQNYVARDYVIVN